MRSILLSMFLAFFISTPVFANITSQDFDLQGLSEAQKIELYKKMENMKEQNTGPTSVEQMKEYADLGQKYGVALAATAKELGKSVDEILNTTVGKVAMVLIVWKVVGQELLGIVMGLLWFSTMIPIWAYFYRRMCVVKSITFEPVEGFRSRKKVVEYYNTNFSEAMHGTRFLMFFALAAICTSGFVMIF